VSAAGEGWVRIRFGSSGQLADVFERHGFDLVLAAFPLEDQVIQNVPEQVGAKWCATFERAQTAEDAAVLESEDVKVTRLFRRRTVSSHRKSVYELAVRFLEAPGGIAVSREASLDEFSDLLRLAQAFQRRSSR
jgi:hypothetical protein